MAGKEGLGGIEKFGDGYSILKEPGLKWILNYLLCNVHNGPIETSYNLKICPNFVTRKMTDDLSL